MRKHKASLQYHIDTWIYIGFIHRPLLLHSQPVRISSQSTRLVIRQSKANLPHYRTPSTLVLYPQTSQYAPHPLTPYPGTNRREVLDITKSKYKSLTQRLL